MKRVRFQAPTGFGCLIAVVLFLGLIVLWSLQASAAAGHVWERYLHTVNSNSIMVEFEASGEPPEFIAFAVEIDKDADTREAQREAEFARWQSEVRTNRNASPPNIPRRNLAPIRNPFANATWIPFQTNLLVDLGPEDGKRTVRFSYRYKGQKVSSGWSGSDVRVITDKPVVWIVNPTKMIHSQPLIQLQGYANRQVHSVRYDIFDERGQKIKTDEEGFAGSNLMKGGYPFKPGEHYFTCFDVELIPGTNTIILRCQDDAGNAMSTNLVYVFTTAGDKTPPIFELHWPKPDMTLAGSSFTARGQSDDATAKMEGYIVNGGRTNFISGFPERNGYFWFEEIPLGIGENRLTLTATDVAGNRVITNLIIHGSEGPTITLDDYDAKKLWDSHINLSGKVSPAQNRVWINGVEATVKPDGSWVAERVPVISPNGGTAIFEMTAMPPGENQRGDAKPQKLLRTQASLGNGPIVLNASTPACGTFQLRLTETAGRPFVLLVSTNLTDWIPLLTNSNPQATFDFTDTQTADHPCRFFRVLPLK